MPVTRDKPGPYAPASAIMSIVERHRNKGLPSVVDGETLQRAGISDSLVARTLYALNVLDLIDEEGKPSAVLEGIRLAPEAEYPMRLREWLNGAYSDALEYIDPETAVEAQVRDAFRTYRPIGQQPRMVSLFLGLYAAAGVIKERPKSAPRASTSGGSKPKPKPVIKATLVASADRTPPRAFANAAPPASGLPPAIAGLLASLPSEGSGWTQQSRDKFMNTLSVVIDYVYPIVAEAAAIPPGPGAENDFDNL